MIKKDTLHMNRLLVHLRSLVWKLLVFSISWIVFLLLRVIKSIRVGYFPSSRIGHYAFDVAWYLASKKNDSDSDKYFDLFFLEYPPSNLALNEIARRHIRGVGLPGRLHRSLVSSPRLKKIMLKPAIHVTGSRDFDGRIFKSETTLSFVPREDSLGCQYLKKCNIEATSKFVCLNVRDEEYVKQLFQDIDQEKDTSYHDYRNSDIESYVDIAEHLAHKGYTVFRMGKYVKSALQSKHPNVVDYALTDDRSDLLDIWLVANCFFCISTGTGLDALAVIFKRPTVYVNMLPLRDFWTSHNCIMAPKKLTWSNNGKLLNVSQYMEHSYHNTNDYTDNGIDVNDLAPKEISAAVLEMEKRLSGTMVESTGELVRQKLFWKQFRRSPVFPKYHDWVNPDARIGAEFLAQFEQSFLE